MHSTHSKHCHIAQPPLALARTQSTPRPTISPTPHLPARTQSTPHPAISPTPHLPAHTKRLTPCHIIRRPLVRMHAKHPTPKRPCSITETNPNDSFQLKQSLVFHSFLCINFKLKKHSVNLLTFSVSPFLKK